MKKNSFSVYLIEIALFTAGFMACLWGPFHVFLRTRFYFDGATPFDYVILAITLILAMIVSGMMKDRPAMMFLIGCGISGLGGYIAMLTTPVWDFSNLGRTIRLFGTIETQVGHIPMCFMLFGAFLGLGGLFRVWMYKLTIPVQAEENKKSAYSIEGSWERQLVMSLVYSLILYLLLAFALPQDSNVPFALIAIGGAAVVVLWAIGSPWVYDAWQFPDSASIFAIKAPQRGGNGLKAVGMFLIWGIYTAIFFAMVLLYFQLAKTQIQITAALNFEGCLCIGLIFVYLIMDMLNIAQITSNFKVRVVIWMVLVVLGCYLPIATYQDWIETGEYARVNWAVGIGLACLTVAYIGLVGRYATGRVMGIRGVGSILLLLTWIVAAFLANMPMHPEDIVALQAWLVPVVVGLCGLFLLLILLLARFVPTLAQMSQNYRTKNLSSPATKEVPKQ